MKLTAKKQAGWSLVFKKFFVGFNIFFQHSRSTLFLFLFTRKVNLRLKSLLTCSKDTLLQLFICLISVRILWY